ncbi:DUF2793 domain-containing protein [Halodurantibacterium flavum]|uniref:DUF2793 domain-containing protein n=1 Tax=Halodurantibacterium flavum TaxID=1382802 RepID=A0ABW4S6A0_9RHOB
MSETVQLGLPLVQAAQAQKHVTVNEALLRLDALAQVTILSRTVTLPPLTATDGQVWSVPQGAVNAWEGRAGQLAIATGGGWVFATPRRGWQGFILDEHQSALFDGQSWRTGVVAMSENRAGSFFRITEFDHEIAAGQSSTPAVTIPAASMVFAVTARVVEPITGSLTTWQLGNPGAPDRFGAGLGTAAGSWARGLLSAPMSFYEPTPLLLSASGGSFAGGRVRFALHLHEVGIPAA